LGGGNIGPVTVNDAAGSSTILHFATNVSSSSAAASSITLNGNWQAIVNVDTANTVTLASLNDGGATATMTDLVLTGKGFAGAGTLDIQSVSDSALATVSAGNLNGAVTLGGDNGITATGSALSQAALVVNGPGSGSGTGTGMMNVYASGAGDVFNFGTSSSSAFTAYFGGNAIHANGAGDVFNLGTAAAITAFSGTDNVFAAGAADKFTVGNGTALGTTFNLHASGAGDTFTLNGNANLDGGTTGAVTHERRTLSSLLMHEGVTIHTTSRDVAAELVRLGLSNVFLDYPDRSAEPLHVARSIAESLPPLNTRSKRYRTKSGQTQNLGGVVVPGGPDGLVLPHDDHRLSGFIGYFLDVEDVGD